LREVCLYAIPASKELLKLRFVGEIFSPSHFSLHDLGACAHIFLTPDANGMIIDTSANVFGNDNNQ